MIARSASRCCVLMMIAGERKVLWWKRLRSFSGILNVIGLYSNLGKVTMSHIWLRNLLSTRTLVSHLMCWEGASLSIKPRSLRLPATGTTFKAVGLGLMIAFLISGGFVSESGTFIEKGVTTLIHTLLLSPHVVYFIFYNNKLCMSRN